MCVTLCLSANTVQLPEEIEHSFTTTLLLYYKIINKETQQLLHSHTEYVAITTNTVQRGDYGASSAAGGRRGLEPKFSYEVS